MKYLGGKFRIAKALAQEIARVANGRPVWEPFCGGLNVTVALGASGVVSDADPALIAMYRAVLFEGWEPPATLTEEQYAAARALPDSDPLKAFAGYLCSFGAKWFAGYARNNQSRDYAREARNVLLRDLGALRGRDIDLCCIDFMAIEPQPTDGHIIYCDPPYRGTTGYRHAFDCDAFARRVLEWSRYTEVLVSEYAFPHGRVIWEHERNLEMQSATPRKRIERLFLVEANA